MYVCMYVPTIFSMACRSQLTWKVLHHWYKAIESRLSLHVERDRYSSFQHLSLLVSHRLKL